MDERFRGTGMWIGLGAAAIVFMCLIMCVFGAVASVTTGRAPAYVQPPMAEEGAAPPPATFGYTPFGMGRHAGYGPFAFIAGGIGLAFKLLFLGFLLLMFAGLLKWLCWGRRHWHHRYPATAPQGEGDRATSSAPWGPWAWHCHGRRRWPPHGHPAPSQGGDQQEGEPDGPPEQED
ncbi:hypothetical protein ACFLT5_01485 [Chloroflexota bacterium]